MTEHYPEPEESEESITSERDLEKATAYTPEEQEIVPVVHEEHEDVSPKRPASHASEVSDEPVDFPPRGRQNSRDSRTSDDSQATIPDDEAHDHQVPGHRSRSRRPRSVRSRAQSSVRSIRPDPIMVPRSERRGLLARFTVIAEITNPYDYSRRMKWIITVIVALAGATAPMGSSVILPGLVNITRDFNSTNTIVNLSIALYMLAMSIFPLWWSSFSETLGRRTIYLVSFFMFFVFNVLCAVSTSISMFIVMRIFAGGAAASVQAVGAGTVSDIWPVRERGNALSIFYLGPLMGPLLSPILGGILVQFINWRASLWFLSIFGFVLCISILFFLPETLKNRKPLAAPAENEAAAITVGNTDKNTLEKVTTQQSIKIKTTKYLVMLRRAFLDPLNIILYLQIPAIAILIAYSAVTFSTVYVLNISVQQTFSDAPYNYSSLIVGCLYIPNSLGYFLTAIFGGRWIDNIMHREARAAGRYDEKGKLSFVPEDRLKENAWIGAALYPCAMIMYGWSANFGVNLAVLLVANFFFGIGSMLIFAVITTMLTEFIPRKSSSGIALNNFVRNILSCVGTIVTSDLINAIGNGWIFTGLGLICLVSGFATIWIMKQRGPRWRLTMTEKMDKLMGD